MRKLAILALMLVAFPTRAGYLPPVDQFLQASGWGDREFKLDENSRRATHILVVDACGQVLDVWKGSARVGDVISLNRVLSPTFPKMTDTRQSRFDWLADTSSYWLDMPGRRDRMILFLVQIPVQFPADVRRQEALQADRWGPYSFGPRTERPTVSSLERVFELYTDRPQQDKWHGSYTFPRTPLQWSECSMAYVDDLGRVHTRGVGVFRGYGLPHALYLHDEGMYDRGRIVPAWRAIGTESDVQQKVWDAINPTRSLD